MSRALYDHAQRLHGILEEAGAVISRSCPPAIEALSSLRRELWDAVSLYQALVHQNVFEPFTAGGRAEDAAAAKRIKADVIYLGEEYRRFTERWRPEDAVRRWQEFQAEGEQLTSLLASSVDASLEACLVLHCAAGCQACEDRLCA